MNWHKNLYFGDAAGKKKKKIMNQLERKKLVLGVYVITLAANQKDLLDILPAFMLFKPQNEQKEILGIAVTKGEAMEVCEKMIMDVYRKTGSFDVRSFFA